MPPPQQLIELLPGKSTDEMDVFIVYDFHHRRMLHILTPWVFTKSSVITFSLSLPPSSAFR